MTNGGDVGSGRSGGSGAPGGCVLERVMPSHVFADMAVAVTPDGSRVVAAGGDGMIRIWNLETGELERDFRADEIDSPHLTVLGGGCVWSVVVTPDGRRIVSGGSDGAVRVWDLATGQLELEIQAHDGEVNAVAISPDGTRIASAGMDYSACLWSLATGDLEHELTADRAISSRPLYSYGVRAVVFTPDGRHVISDAARREAALQVWDVATGRLELTLDGPEDQAHALAVTPDGSRAVSGGDDGKLRVWSLAGGHLERTIEGHAEEVRALAITPDGRDVVSGDYDGVVLVTALAGGRVEFKLEASHGSTLAIALTPDGRRIVTSGDDGEMRVWSLRSGLALAGPA